jgi:hypothetical protein
MSLRAALIAVAAACAAGAARRAPAPTEDPTGGFQEPSAADREQAPAGTAVDLSAEPALLHARGERLAQ